MSSDTSGPIILWLDYGYEGWAPYSFQTLEEALQADRSMAVRPEGFVITYRIKGPEDAS